MIISLSLFPPYYVVFVFFHLFFFFVYTYWLYLSTSIALSLPFFLACTWNMMQLAIDEDRRVQKPDEGLEIEAEAGSAQRGSDDWARWYHQWRSRKYQGSTQVNLTGVYRAMYWALYTVQERARTMLCYRYRPMAKEELGKGLPATNGKRRAYQKAQSGNERREARHSH